MSKRTRGDRGAAMVEFALILPVLLILLVGLIQFGRAYNLQISMQAGAREGARELALRQPAKVNSAVTANIPASVTLDTFQTTPCPASGDGQASVVLEENVTFGIPFIPVFTKTLEATGVMRCGL